MDKVNDDRITGKKRERKEEIEDGAPVFKKSKATVSMEYLDNPGSINPDSLLLDSFNCLEEATKRYKCSKCDKNRKYFCYDCYQITIPKVNEIPKIQLPVEVVMYVLFGFH